MFSVTGRTEENFSKKRGTREREGTTDCGKWKRKMMQTAFQNIKMLRESGQQKQPSVQTQSLGRRSTLVVALCHPWPPYQSPSNTPPSLAPFHFLYLYLRLKVKITRIMFTAMCSFSDESQGTDFFGLFLAAMDLIVEFWEVWGKGAGNREGPHVFPSLLLLSLIRSQWSYCWESPSSMHEGSYSPLNCRRNDNGLGCFYYCYCC